MTEPTLNPQPSTLNPEEVAEQIKAAAHELYEANSEVEEAQSALERAKLRRDDADIRLARTAPWSRKPQYIQILLSPVDRALVRIIGDPDETGRDCEVLPLSSIEHLAQIKCDRAADRKVDDDIPF